MPSRVPMLTEVSQWWPALEAKPRFAKTRDGRLHLSANGTRACSGAWRLRYRHAVPEAWYDVAVDLAYEDLEHPRDAVGALVRWACAEGTPVLDQLLPEPAGPGAWRLRRVVQAPAGAVSMVVECFLRWSQTGRSSWSLPAITPVDAPEFRTARVCVVTGSLPRVHARTGHTIASNVSFYADLCERACRAVKPDLLALPEVVPQWQVPGSCLETALPLPSPETEAFAKLARKHRTHLAFGVMERDGDAVFNTAALLDRRGKLVGKYHKVHLASGAEWSSGILPGDGFPVFTTDIGRIGFNICMDSSAAESARGVALNGADFLVLPIMGDHRADRWSVGRPYFSESRWQAIMRTHAMDNQLCMVVARNEAHGSCVVDRKGEILAWNEGTVDHIIATVNLDDGYRTFIDGGFEEVNWIQRRPHLYGPFVDENNVGSLR